MKVVCEGAHSMIRMAGYEKGKRGDVECIACWTINERLGLLAEVVNDVLTRACAGMPLPISIPHRPRIKQQRKQPPLNLLPFRNHRHAGQQRLIAHRAHSVAEHIHQRRPPRPVRAVRIRPMHRQRMVERALSALQLDRNRPECLLLLLIQHGHDLVHVARKPCNRQQVPLVAPGNVVQEPLSRVLSSSAIQHVKCDIGCVRVQYE